MKRQVGRYGQLLDRPAALMGECLGKVLEAGIFAALLANGGERHTWRAGRHLGAEATTVLWSAAMCIRGVVERRAVESVWGLRAFDAALGTWWDLGQVERACWRGRSAVLSPGGAGRYRWRSAHYVYLAVELCLVGSRVAVD